MTASTGRVHIHENQLLILDEDPSPDYLLDANPFVTRFVGATEGAVVILTGIDTGYVTVTVEIHSTEPPSKTGWNEVQTVIFESDGTARLSGWDRSPQRDFPDICAQGPGIYNVRVHARDRKVGQMVVTLEPLEQYLIQVWPA